MFYFVADLIEDVRQYISPILISAEALSLASAVNRRIPLEMVSTVGFEIRLLANHHQIDFLYRIHASHSAWLINLKSPTFDDASWDQIRNFARAWTDESSPLAKSVEQLWMEFDGVESRITIPGVYIEPPDSPPSSLDWQVNPHIIFDEVLPRLMGQPLATEVRKTAENCIKMIPAEFGFFAVGLFLSRNADFLRMNFSNVSLPLLLDYLQAIHWTGDLKMIQALWERYCKDLPEAVFRVALDMQADVLPRLGLEIHVPAIRPANAENWDPIFQQLIADDLCSPEKAHALKGWVRNMKTKLPIHTQPMILRWGLGHIKLTYQVNQPLEAKAYFGMRFILPPHEYTFCRLTNHASRGSADHLS